MENPIENTYTVFIRIASDTISISIKDENELQMAFQVYRLSKGRD